MDFDTPNARNASGRGGRTATFKFYEIPDNLAAGATLTVRGVTVAEFDGDRIFALRQCWEEVELLDSLNLRPHDGRPA